MRDFDEVCHNLAVSIANTVENNDMDGSLHPWYQVSATPYAEALMEAYGYDVAMVVVENLSDEEYFKHMDEYASVRKMIADDIENTAREILHLRRQERVAKNA